MDLGEGQLKHFIKYDRILGNILDIWVIIFIYIALEDSRCEAKKIIHVRPQNYVVWKYHISQLPVLSVIILTVLVPVSAERPQSTERPQNTEGSDI